ncbi:MAG TPA: RNA polymerase sigma factor [Vicinamibacterales bacterium]|jgi:RNA polymerase sigma-70 factor (ECF subfamily)|nr:RNA polymerase sigma factor [Vicinamibacterales bacterium]
MDVTDRATVLARAQGGDSEAFQALVEEHSRRVFQLAYRITGNEHDAEDVVQESFLRAYRQLSHFEQRANFGTWLYRIVANCAVDSLRTRRSRGDHQVHALVVDEVIQAQPTPGPGPERLAESAEIQRRVSAAMDELTPVERAAFTLRHYEGRSIDEICRTLNLKTSAAKHSVFRAVKKLRTALEPLRTPGLGVTD